MSIFASENNIFLLNSYKSWTKNVKLWKISVKDLAADVSSLFNAYEMCRNNKL